jgi:hypothetical protein
VHPASRFAGKVCFLGGRSFSSDNKCVAFTGLQPLRKRFESFFRKLLSDGRMRDGRYQKKQRSTQREVDGRSGPEVECCNFLSLPITDRS